ncbi:hypothetical protein [Streptomyces bobili]|uniref:hypothetical protein n=1 Tax=Streptomyces bobili TaxID=67280 RepID=UPI003719D112
MCWEQWIAVTCWLLALSGAAVIGWSWYSQLADEADRRGEAVSTLASDVRILRAQVTAAGETGTRRVGSAQPER